MKLLSLNVQGFGALRPGLYEFGDRTLVVAGNAAGKTTLAAALRAALFGLQGDKRTQRLLTDLEAYEPWQGGPYGLTLKLEAGGRVYTVQRDFTAEGASARAAGRLTVWGPEGEVTARFLAGKEGDKVGRELLGVGPAEFDRTVLAGDAATAGWVGGAGAAGAGGLGAAGGGAGGSGRGAGAERGGATLSDLLARAVTTEAGGGTAGRAVAACDEALRQYEGFALKGLGQVDTEIKRLQEQAREVQERGRALEGRHAEALAVLAELEAQRERLAGLDAELAAVRRRRLQAQVAEARRAQAARRRAEAELSSARERLEALAPLAGFPHERERDLASLAERCTHALAQVRFQERRVAETVAPRVDKLAGELGGLGPVPEGQVLAELAAGVGALQERERVLAGLRAERQRRLAAVQEEGESVEEMEAVQAGLSRLGEADRQFLREQERDTLEEANRAERLVIEEKQLRDEMAGWAAAAAAARRWAWIGWGVAIAGAALAAGALALGGGAGGGALARPGAGAAARGLPAPAGVLVAAGAVLALAGVALALWRRGRAAGLDRRQVLQGQERLAALEAQRQELQQRREQRGQRMAVLAPAMLGEERAAELAPTPGAMAALLRRYDKFRNRHEEWFRLAARLEDEAAEQAKAKERLRPFLPDAAASPADPAQIPVAAYQRELERRQQVEALQAELAAARDQRDAAEREARRFREQAETAAREAAVILLSVPASCPLPDFGQLGDDPAAGAARGGGARASGAGGAGGGGGGAEGGPGAGDDRSGFEPTAAELAALFRLGDGIGDAGEPAGAARQAAAFARQPRRAVQWFAEKAAQARAALALREETVPALERRVAEQPPAADLERSLAALEQELARLAAEPAAAVAGDALPGPAATVAELTAAADDLQRRRDGLAREIAQRAAVVGEVEKERRVELPRLRRELAALQGHLDRALRFRDAVRLAREAIDRLSGEVYDRWSAALGADAGRLVARLSPEIAGVTFHPDLDWRVTLANGRELDAARAERQLSGGVRDQLALAIRLALARFLAQPGDPLPLLLDDPFARYDDDRFRRAMTVLLDEAPGHQIVLLTCHAERLRWFAEVEPEAAGRWGRIEMGGAGAGS